MTPESQPAQGDTLAAVVAELRSWFDGKDELVIMDAEDVEDIADRLEKLAAVPVGATEALRLAQYWLANSTPLIEPDAEHPLPLPIIAAALAQPPGAGKQDA